MLQWFCTIRANRIIIYSQYIMSEEILDIEFSDSGDEQPSEQQKDPSLIQLRTLKPKPRKRIMTAKQLETSRRNLQKAHATRKANKAKNKQTEKEQSKNQQYERVVVDDDDDYTDDSEYSEEEPAPKRKSKQKGTGEKITKSEQKMMEKLEKMESIIEKLTAKSKKPKSVHKTVIVQPNNNYPQYGRNPAAEGLKKGILLDIFN